MKIEDIMAPYQYDAQNPPQILDSFEGELNWFGTKRSACIARVIFDTASAGYFIFWRLEGDDGAWCLGSGGSSPRIHRVLGVIEESPEKQIHRTQSTYRRRGLCRLFFLPKLQQYVSVTSSRGAFYWTFEKPIATFSMKWGDIKNWQCCDTKNYFDNALVDEESSAHFALNVVQANQREDGEILFGFDDSAIYTEQLKQFKVLFSAFLRSSNSIWESHSEYTFVLGQRGSYYSSAPLKTVNSELIGVPLSGSEEKWLNLIKRFGPLRISKKRLENYYFTWWEEKPKALISISVSSPTFHERLEAKLQLLEWARTHIPPKKYAEVEAMET